MTTIASTAEARSAAASWRWRVAEQMVFFTMGSSPASRRAALNILRMASVVMPLPRVDTKKNGHSLSLSSLGRPSSW